jgi:hypothetical protein
VTPAAVLNSLLRFVALLLLQLLIFNQAGWGWGGRTYLFIFVYPLFLALLPLRTPRPLVILLAFLLGISVDFFSETLGLHAGALAFAAYCRPLVLHAVRPRDGYNIKASPTAADLGASWMLSYLALLLLAHLSAFFLLQTFSILFIGEIVLKVLFSLPVSLLVIGTLALLFNPKV